ncbi:exported protein of unknown function [Streptomyces sp. KY70]|nr:exported protein of unknown function [Streptomyces sp. KY70]
MGSSGVIRAAARQACRARAASSALALGRRARTTQAQPRRVDASGLSGSASSQSLAQSTAEGISARPRTRCPRRSQSFPVVTSRARASPQRPWVNWLRASMSSWSSRAGSKAWSERPPRRRERPRGGGGGDMPQTSFDAVCEQMIAHSKAVGNAPSQEVVSTNCSPFPDSWPEVVGPGEVFAQRAGGMGGCGVTPDTLRVWNLANLSPPSSSPFPARCATGWWRRSSPVKRSPPPGCWPSTSWRARSFHRWANGPR